MTSRSAKAAKSPAGGTPPASTAKQAGPAKTAPVKPAPAAAAKPAPPARAAATKASKAASTKGAPAKAAPAAKEASPPAKKAPSGSAPKRPAPARAAAPVGEDLSSPAFLAEQRVLLLEERASYTKQAEELKAEADSLALEHEPGDVQFDEEGGEGGTSNVDRELDLVLSAQARAAILEIDRAMTKLDNGTYGICEQCSQPIPKARLQALPYAALCVACKSGGLSRRTS